MHPASNYRQSRRSACDRCRGFKLRCERDQVSSRSCERCLKAQVVCTTSISHPTQGFNTSKSNPPALPSKYDGSYFSFDGFSMPALHKPCLSRVRKPLGSQGMLRRHDNQRFPSWRQFDPYSYVECDLPCGSKDLALSFLPNSSLSAPHEHWSDATPAWDLTFPTLPIGSSFLESENHLSVDVPFSDTFATSSLSSGLSELIPNAVDHSNLFADPPQISEEDLALASSTNLQEDPVGGEESQLASSSIGSSPSSYSIQKRLLGLNLALIEDLEHLEWDLTAPSSMHFVGDNMTPLIIKLDVPVFRMLNHSAKFLEIIDFGKFPSEAQSALCSGTEHPRIYSHNITQSPSKPFIEEAMEDGVATVSSLDSGYLTAMVSPQDTSQLSPPTHKLPVFLTILTTYSHLVRLYHTIFTQLYQMFLIIPPPEDTRFLMLSNSQYGQMGMDGNLTVQVQAIVELGFNMLTKLENAIELQSAWCSESKRPSSYCGSVLENASFAAIREQIVAHEGLMSGIPLKETMSCLSQLVKASGET